jgi:hypothetical protein
MVDRRQLLERIAAGDGVGPLAGLSLDQLKPMIDAAEAAFQERRLPLARRLFTALETLFPSQGGFIVRRAAIEAEAGERLAALEALKRFFSREAMLEPELTRNALMLQAALLDGVDDPGAARSRADADKLGSRRPRNPAVAKQPGGTR